MEDARTAPAPEAAPETAAAPRTRHPRRTTLLIAAAVALGVLAGTVTGYAVQYHRAPTPLPPLAQQSMAALKPLAADGNTSLRSVNAHRWHKTDDDLSTLLLEAPAGAEIERSGPMSLDEHATDYYDNPDDGLRFLLRDDVRRIVLLRWSGNGRNSVSIRLFQYQSFRDAEDRRAFSEGQETRAGDAGKEIPGVPADYGHLWIDSKATREPGYEPVRGARAIARRGDIVMDISSRDYSGVIDERVFADLAKRQWERL
ncbi:hypothetical protein [Streptomyces sp. NPDC051567]|uniref:hypothetical protein n=1 Tax=Streptomyces sp. NPDC051567 TaxID=3365660 RepID=UPI0037B9D578